ncbi:uncharacterized protein LOC131061373 [Cryptomeria japonica]|uniref:uncharacterized protein LOC131061373 n=1 Tax=Cryptomeria japonica TaxID=3369 RepID=UPI0025ABB2A7|nr:uncharacterized protein LOC131061373 [Cryptomeria japonica]
MGNPAAKGESSSQKRKEMERPYVGKKPTRTSHTLKKKFEGKAATGERIEILSSKYDEEESPRENSPKVLSQFSSSSEEEKQEYKMSHSEEFSEEEEVNKNLGGNKELGGEKLNETKHEIQNMVQINEEEEQKEVEDEQEEIDEEEEEAGDEEEELPGHYGEINLNIDLNIGDNASRPQQTSQDKPDNERIVATKLANLAEAAEKVNQEEQQTKVKVSVHVPPSFSWGSIAFGLLQLLENNKEEWKGEKEVL